MTTTYSVKASVTADVEILIEADSAAEAEVIFKGAISMTANLVDADAEKFTVVDDSISQIDHLVALTE